MFATQAGTPAGYGYFVATSVANENIMPKLVQHLKVFEDFGSIMIGTMCIQVKADVQVSINGRAPVLVQANKDFVFDARGLHSVVFDTDNIAFNIICNY